VERGEVLAAVHGGGDGVRGAGVVGGAGWQGLNTPLKNPISPRHTPIMPA